MQDGRNRSGSLTRADLSELRKIILKDYCVNLNDEELESFGLSLLKITRLALTAFNQAEDKHAITVNH